VKRGYREDVESAQDLGNIGARTDEANLPGNAEAGCLRDELLFRTAIGTRNDDSNPRPGRHFSYQHPCCLQQMVEVFLRRQTRHRANHEIVRPKSESLAASIAIVA